MKLEDLKINQLKEVIKHYNLGINCTKLNKKDIIKEILKLMEYKGGGAPVPKSRYEPHDIFFEEHGYYPLWYFIKVLGLTNGPAKHAFKQQQEVQRLRANNKLVDTGDYDDYSIEPRIAVGFGFKKVRGGDISQSDIDEWNKQYQAGFDNGKSHAFDGTLSIVQNVPKSKYNVNSPQNKYYYDAYTIGQNDALKQTSTLPSNLPDAIKDKWQKDYDAGVAYATQTLGTDAKTIQEAPYIDYKPSGINATWNGKSPDVDDSQKYYFEPKIFGYNAQLKALKANYNYHSSEWDNIKDSFVKGFTLPFSVVSSLL